VVWHGTCGQRPDAETMLTYEEYHNELCDTSMKGLCRVPVQFCGCSIFDIDSMCDCTGSSPAATYHPEVILSIPYCNGYGSQHMCEQLHLYTIWVRYRQTTSLAALCLHSIAVSPFYYVWTMCVGLCVCVCVCVCV
jgi:hypothetical protein